MFKVLVIILSSGIETLATQRTTKQSENKSFNERRIFKCSLVFYYESNTFTINNLENTGRCKEVNKSSFIPPPLDNNSTVCYIFFPSFSMQMDMIMIIWNFKQNWDHAVYTSLYPAFTYSMNILNFQMRIIEHSQRKMLKQKVILLRLNIPWNMWPQGITVLAPLQGLEQPKNV